MKKVQWRTGRGGYWRWPMYVAVWGGVLVACAVLGTIVVYGQAHWWEEHKTERGRGDTSVVRIDQGPAQVYEMPDTFGNVATKCVGEGKRAWVTTKGGIEVTDDPRCPATTWEIVRGGHRD